MALNQEKFPKSQNPSQQTDAQRTAAERNFAKFTLTGFEARLIYLQTHLEAVKFAALKAAIEEANASLSTKPLKG